MGAFLSVVTIRFFLAQIVFHSVNRGAYLFDTTVGADNANQVGTAELEIVGLTDSVQLLQVLTL